MILVAFVLVLVATVMLIIGTFFDAGVAYIWISIGACVATFVVLGISYMARRRSAEAPAARPEPLAANASRSVAGRPAPRSGAEGATGVVTTGAASGGAATAVQDRDADTPTDDDSTVKIVAREPDPPSTDEPTAAVGSADAGSEEEVGATVDTPAGEPALDDTVGASDDAPTDDDVVEPAPRRVAPRRVVRRAPAAPAAPTAPAASAAPVVWPSGDDADEAAADAAGQTPSAAAPETTTGGPTGTRRVVRRVQPGEAGPRGDGAQGQRVVRRVVRRAAPADGAAAAATSTSGASAGDRSGTRGKRARAVLSGVKGVGPAKQDALLKRFGSLENMAAASLDELTAVKGVGENAARAIKQALQDR